MLFRRSGNRPVLTFSTSDPKMTGGLLRLTVASVCLLFCLAITGWLPAADTISGKWIGEWGPNNFERNRVMAELRYDGKAVTGTFNPGTNAATISKGTFNEKSGAVHLEAEGRGRGGVTIHYVIDGKLENGKITGAWKYENGKGDFVISKE